MHVIDETICTATYINIHVKKKRGLVMYLCKYISQVRKIYTSVFLSKYFENL